MSLAMKVGSGKKRLLVTVAASLLCPAGFALADFGNSINQLGRISGAGWGDGYHACQSSGHQLGADLPPKSFSQRQSKTSAQPAKHHLRRAAATFYDRFDAANDRPCDSPVDCDVIGCDSPSIMIDGSHVIQSPPAAPRAEGHRSPEPAERSRPLPPTLTPIDSVPSAPLPSSPLPGPRDTTPDGGEPNDAKPADAKPADAKPADAEPSLIKPISELKEETSVSITPLQSQWPTRIEPTHPGERSADRIQRLLQEANCAGMPMPIAPARIRQEIADPVVKTPSALPLGATNPATETVPSYQFTPPEQPAKPPVNQQTSTPNAFTLPSIPDHSKTEPSLEMPSTALAAAVVNPTPVPNVTPVPSATASNEQRPSRLGQVFVSAATTSRLGTAGSVAKSPSPAKVLPRAVVELAKRYPHPDSAVIRQPR